MKARDRLGPYRLAGELGSGGMGSVFLAHVEQPTHGLDVGAPVALKVIHPHLLQRSDFVERFRREADVGRSVDHENVVRTYALDVLEGSHVLVMEYVEGKTLRALQEELDPVPEELCRTVGREICRGLAAIHAAGVVHRDLKPENVLISPDHKVKVMDLGLARIADEALRLSVTGVFVGSIEYAAPEQFSDGGREVDLRADLYAVGLLLYELSSGVHPYAADDMAQAIRRVLYEEPRRLGELQPQLSPFFEEVVHTLLAKDREQRFASAEELGRVLEEGEASAWWRERARTAQASSHRPLRRIRVRRDTAVFGREGELVALRAAFEHAQAGHGAVVLVEGEPGIGKSRLVDELIARLQREGTDLNFLSGAYPPAGAATAAGAFSTAYREHLGEAGSAAWLAETPRLVPAFDALLRGEPPPAGAEPLSQGALETCFVHVTRGLASERTTVVFVDDLHFAPEEGRALFTALALAVPGHRILLIGATRPDVPSAWRFGITQLAHALHLDLARLGKQDLFLLLHDVFGSEDIASRLVEPIALKSDGNPFFAFEIARGLQESRFVAQNDDGTWALSGAVQAIQIPSSVLDIVQARTAGLGPEDRGILEVASCLGFEFDPAWIADALRMPILPVLQRFAGIERRFRLVRAKGRVYAFDHHQVQETLYAALSAPVRQQHHSALARALEEREKAAERDPHAIDGAVCVDLCEHFLQGTEQGRALRYLEAALEHLDAGCLHVEALELAERALAVDGLLRGPERVRVLLRVGSHHNLLGHRVQQVCACREAEEVARLIPDPALHARAARALGTAHLRVAEHGPAEHALEAALAIARREGLRAEEAAATGGLGRLYWAQGRIAEARACHERHLRLARESSDRRAEAHATLDLGNVCLSEGRLDEAGGHYQRLLEIAREIGDRPAAAAATANLGNVHLLQGRIAAARTSLGQAVALARENGDREGQARATGNLGAVFHAEGRWSEAAVLLGRALALSREIRDRRGEANALTNLAEVLVAQGFLEAARERHEEHLALCRKAGLREGEVLALLGLGGVARLLGDAAVARLHFERALDVARSVGMSALEAAALFGLGAVLADAGARGDAVVRHEEALRLRRSMGDRRGVANSLLALAELHQVAEDLASARKATEEALEAAEATGDPSLRVRAAGRAALLDLRDPHAAADVLAAHGERLAHFDRIEARYLLWRATGERGHLLAARRLLDVACEHAPDEQRVAMAENVPLHRAVRSE